IPHTYSSNKYSDMVYILYEFCDGNVNAARYKYAARFPNRRLSDKSVFSLTFQRLKETGSFNMVPRADGPSTSTRRSGSALGTSFTKCLLMIFNH
ncbi:hypothetical protein ALC60_05387, partial [Trachymyrmex zeteki]